MNLLISYQSAKFQEVLQLSESNFTEVSIRHPKTPLWRHYDVTSQYLVFKIAHFVELSRSYQPAKFHLPRLSVSNFMRAGGKHPPQTYTLSKSPVLIESSHLGVHRTTSIQTFDFSTLYTSIPQDLLKSHMNSIINNAFKHKNGATRYTHIKVGRNKSYFTSDPLSGDNKYTANDICKMIEFLVDNIYVRFGGQLFRQVMGIPMGTNCPPLLADLFLYSYESEY